MSVPSLRRSERRLRAGRRESERVSGGQSFQRVALLPADIFSGRRRRRRRRFSVFRRAVSLCERDREDHLLLVTSRQSASQSVGRSVGRSAIVRTFVRSFVRSARRHALFAGSQSVEMSSMSWLSIAHGLDPTGG